MYLDGKTLNILDVNISGFTVFAPNSEVSSTIYVHYNT